MHHDTCKPAAVTGDAEPVRCSLLCLPLQGESSLFMDTAHNMAFITDNYGRYSIPSRGTGTVRGWRSKPCWVLCFYPTRSRATFLCL